MYFINERFLLLTAKQTRVEVCQNAKAHAISKRLFGAGDAGRVGMSQRHQQVAVINIAIRNQRQQRMSVSGD